MSYEAMNHWRALEEERLRERIAKLETENLDAKQKLRKISLDTSAYVRITELEVNRTLLLRCLRLISEGIDDPARFAAVALQDAAKALEQWKIETGKGE